MNLYVLLVFIKRYIYIYFYLTKFCNYDLASPQHQIHIHCTSFTRKQTSASCCSWLSVINGLDPQDCVGLRWHSKCSPAKFAQDLNVLKNFPTLTWRIHWLQLLWDGLPQELIYRAILIFRKILGSCVLYIYAAGGHSKHSLSQK